MLRIEKEEHLLAPFPPLFPPLSLPPPLTCTEYGISCAYRRNTFSRMSSATKKRSGCSLTTFWEFTEVGTMRLRRGEVHGNA